MPRLVVCPVWKEARDKHWVTDVIFPDIIQKCSLGTVQKHMSHLYVTLIPLGPWRYRLELHLVRSELPEQMGQLILHSALEKGLLTFLSFFACSST